MPDLHAEAVDVLQRLIRFNTVNPPGAEREAIRWLEGYLADAGLDCELAGTDPERPNLVATLRGEADGPVLGYLGHVDTVLADPGDWQRDPWGGDIVDGELWGRGAVDMKQQVATEAVAAAHLARQGWRPPRGALKVFAVVDEEAGSRAGAKWLCAERPDLARCDYLVNEGGGWHMPYGDQRLYPVGIAEKGTFRFRVSARGRAGHASVPGIADNALLKLAPVLSRFAAADAPFVVGEPARATLAAIGLDPEDPESAVRAVAEVEPGLAALLAPALQVTFAPTRIRASEKINVVPAHAALEVDCRLPPGVTPQETLARVRELAGDGVEVEPLDEIIGNASSAHSPLMDAIAEWLGRVDPGARALPVIMPAYTDSASWRDAFPECVAYGFCPMKSMSLYEAWPLMHGADERIRVDDVHLAADFFAHLAPTLLA